MFGVVVGFHVLVVTLVLWLLLVGCAGRSGSFLILFVCFGWSWLWLLALVVLCWFLLVGNDCAEFVFVFG